MDILLCTIALEETTLQKLRSTFSTVHYHPDATRPISTSILNDAEMLLCSGGALVTERNFLNISITSMDKLPQLRHIQLTTSGANAVLSTPVFQEYLKNRAEVRACQPAFSVATASGIHALTIPNYVVSMTILFLHQLHTQILLGRTHRRWLSQEEAYAAGEGKHARTSIGRTVGLLGYGTIGRETARLLRSHGMRVIAANTSGRATKCQNYMAPGTGDEDGGIPDTYYSTDEPDSLEAFLRECDVLVASLPATAKTASLLTAYHLTLLKQSAIFINVGRGDLISSDEILTALDTNRLLGVALDVTDPEPLPEDHPLWSHPRCVITPHTSGDTENELDVAVDVAIENVRRIRAEEPIMNRVDYQKGY